MEFLMFVIALCVPSALVAYCHRQTQRRMERTNVDRLNYEYAMRRLEIEHEAKLLALPSSRDAK